MEFYTLIQFFSVWRLLMPRAIRCCTTPRVAATARWSEDCSMQAQAVSI